MRRLYLQYRPTADSLRQLQQLQAELGTDYPAAQLVGEAQLHVTLLHFGILERVFSEVHAVNLTLEQELFRYQVDQFVKHSEPVLPASATLAVESFDLFGSAKDVLVLRLATTPDLTIAHQTALQALRACLVACGIVDAESFMHTNYNFQHALTFRPHLTLFKRVTTLPDQPPKLKNLQMALMPTRYD